MAAQKRTKNIVMIILEAAVGLKCLKKCKRKKKKNMNNVFLL